LKCPFCSYKKTRVIDKRSNNKNNVVRRRRACPKCKNRFTTYEKIECHNLNVIKKDGRVERFDKNKIINGLLKAFEKRPITREKIDKIANEIEIEIMNLGKKEISSKQIGEIIIKKLKAIDKIAYIRFASVYKEFNNLELFECELKKLRRYKL